ncbi:MAG: hypothetical protein GXO07_02230 [Crenarchaeota archaeon]|nr:hypothetical protein [Thermoproteota archaeon]
MLGLRLLPIFLGIASWDECAYTRRDVKGAEDQRGLEEGVQDPHEVIYDFVRIVFGEVERLFT